MTVMTHVAMWMKRAERRNSLAGGHSRKGLCACLRALLECDSWPGVKRG